MKKESLKNGAVLGGIMGLLLTVPSLASWVTNFLTETLPDTWLLLGSYSIPADGVLLGVVIGYIIDAK